MRYELENVEPIAGISVHPAAKGANVLIMVSGRLTADGDPTFYPFMEQIQGHFLKPYTEAGGTPSTIDRLLVIFRKDQTASVFVNDLNIQLKCIMNKPKDAGETVWKRDVVGVGELNIVDVEIPQDASIIFFCSHGWRRGVYFDFRPTGAAGVEAVDAAREFGKLYESLWFAELFSITADRWPVIFEHGWFPFIPLIGGVFETLPSHMDMDLLPLWEERVYEVINEPILLQMLDDWKTVSHLEHHVPFLELGVKQYLEGDYISSINNVWPRVEGVLRFVYSGSSKKPQQNEILEDMGDVLENQAVTPQTYMPQLFREYLLTFYFKKFDVPEGVLDVSRHSVAHGVSESEDYSRRKALIGLLIVHQLYYYLKLGWEQKSDSPPGEESS